MHRPVVLSSAIFAAVIAVAGCGAAKGALSGKDPNTAVQDAVRQAQSTSLHLNLKGSLGVDRSDLANVPAEIDSALAAIGKGGTASGQVDQESNTRRKLTGQVEGGKSATLVEYDGKLYASDDGTHFSEVTSKDTGMQSQLASFDLTKIVSAFTFQDTGADTQDGRSVEHYTAPLTVDTINKLAQNLGSSLARTFWTVTLPIVVPSVLSGALLVFIETIENFGVPAVLAEARVTPFRSSMSWA